MNTPTDPTPAPTNASVISTDAQIALGAVGTILEVLIPGGAVAGIGISTIISVAKGVAQGIPAIVAAYEDIRAAIDGQQPPTQAQLLALKAAVDAGDDEIQAAAQQPGT